MIPSTSRTVGRKGLVTRRSSIARLFYLLFASVQLALPPVAAWADAAGERASSTQSVAGPHVEAHTGSGCARIHPADCALCHAACASFTVPATHPLLVPARRADAPGPDVARRRAPADGSAWDARPRAPPSRG